MEPFDGHLLDERAFVPDLEDLLGRIDEEDHRRSCQRLLDVIRFEIHIDTAIGAHATGEGLLMKALKPAIRIHLFGQRRKNWQGGKSDARGLILTRTPLVRALLVVVEQKALGHLTHLLQGGWSVDL
jgi:hypothetical protein